MSLIGIPNEQGYRNAVDRLSLRVGLSPMPCGEHALAMSTRPRRNMRATVHPPAARRGPTADAAYDPGPTYSRNRDWGHGFFFPKP
jgi:hypothetical protein